MNDVLRKIISHKREEVERLKKELPVSEIIDAPSKYPRYDFMAALSDPAKISIIAEIKKASPSKGVICADFDPVNLARQYEEGGAAAVSVLTDREYFQGEGKYIGMVKEAVRLPALCKEFIIDPYQIYLARFWGADAVLLIAACLPGESLLAFISLAKELGLVPLVEVHNKKELQEALHYRADVIGVNNRDLDTFSVNLKVSEELATGIPEEVIKVSESGIFKRDDIERLRKAGYSNFLVGEAIMRSGDIPNYIKGLWQ